MKLEREALALYIDSTFKNILTSAKWEIIGSDIEDMSTDLNPDVDKIKNILGETKVNDNGYEPETDVDTFYANPDSDLYKAVRDLAMERKKGEACKTLTLEVLIEDTSADTHKAYVQEVLVKPQSYGGDTGGLNFPFKIEENGTRTVGTVTAASLKSGTPTFTAGVGK